MKAQSKTQFKKSTLEIWWKNIFCTAVTKIRIEN